MEAPQTLKHEKMPGFATTDGQDFEVNLAALLFLRGLNSGVDFQLGTNVKGAGALDDVVFRYKSPYEPHSWQTIYVQLKHKDKGTVSRKVLKNSKSGFFLPKYFKSYFEIKQVMSAAERETLFQGSFEECLFVIFTNAKGGASLGERRSANDLNRAERFVWFGCGSVFSFETDEEMLECLGECGDEGRTFLNRLRVFCGQPSAKDLRDIVKKELSDYVKAGDKVIHGIDVDRFCEYFLGNVITWWESKVMRSDILDRNHKILESAMNKVRSESCLAEERFRLQSSSEQTLKENKLDLRFLDAAIEKLPVSFPLTLVECSESSCRLSLTKLLQGTEGQSLVLDCENLQVHKRALLAEWRRADVKRLFVCTADWHSELSNEYFEVINEMLATRDTFPVQDVVLLSDGIGSSGFQLTEAFEERCQCYKDVFTFATVQVKSRNEILNKVVMLQGYKTTLGEILNKDYETAAQLLDASFVVEILKSVGPLTVGPAFPEGIEYYVDRSLEQASVKASVFHAFQGTFTIWITQCEAFDGGLLEKAIDFLSSLQDSHASYQTNVKGLANKFNHLQLVRDETDGDVYFGPKFTLGLYEFNCVGLRFGQDDAATALWARPNKGACHKACFLFVSKETKEDDAGKLSEYLHSEHSLSLKDGKLRWIRSHENIECVRPHVDADHVVRFATETATDVADRLVLVCAEPGMGKSTLMARLAKNTKAALPHYLVVLIAVNDHTKLFAQGKHTDELGFVSSAAEMDSPIQRSFIKFALEVSGNAVVIVDGFDEVAPKYVEECCYLMSSLNRTKARKIWMTSRNSMKQILESSFSKFSTRLCQFNENEQRSFLKKFWQRKSKLNDGELEDFINQVLEKTSQAVRDKEKSFMGIPLQTRMLAEIYEDHVAGHAKTTQLHDRLDLLTLLDLFVDKKCNVYVQDKLMLQPHSAAYEINFEIFRNDFMNSHLTAALGLVMDDDDLKGLDMEWVIQESSEFCKKISCGKDKTGFIDGIVNDRPRFIHRVFAEYFVAIWISKHFAGHSKLITLKLFTADFVVIRSILDRILAKGCALHAAVLDEDVDKVRTFLEEVNVEAKDGGDRTALHLAAALGAGSDREESARRGEILDLLIGKTTDFDQVDCILGGTPLRYADITQWWSAIDKLVTVTENTKQLVLTSANVARDDMLEAIFDQDLDRLIGYCLDNGLAIDHCSKGTRRQLLHRAARASSLKTASLLIERNAKISRRESVDDECNVRDFSEYVNVNDEKGLTPMHHAVWGDRSAEVIAFLISQGGDIQCRDHDNWTPLNFAAEMNDLDAMRVLLEAMDEADRAAAVNSCDIYGESLLNQIIQNVSLECIDVLVQAGAKLSQVSRRGKTPLMAAASEGKHDVVERLLQNFCAKQEGMSKLDYVTLRGKNGTNALHLAVRMVLSDVTSFPISQGCDTEGFEYYCNTPKYDHARTLRSLLNAVTDSERIAAVNSCDDEGDSVLSFAVEGGSLQCVELLVQAGAKLTRANFDGETPLMVAASECNKDVLECLLRNFSVEREGMSRVDFINMADKDGKTVLDKADRECAEAIGIWCSD